MSKRKSWLLHCVLWRSRHVLTVICQHCVQTQQCKTRPGAVHQAGGDGLWVHGHTCSAASLSAGLKRQVQVMTRALQGFFYRAQLNLLKSTRIEASWKLMERENVFLLKDNLVQNVGKLRHVRRGWQASWKAEKFWKEAMHSREPEKIWPGFWKNCMERSRAVRAYRWDYSWWENDDERGVPSAQQQLG